MTLFSFATFQSLYCRIIYFTLSQKVKNTFWNINNYINNNFIQLIFSFKLAYLVTKKTTVSVTIMFEKNLSHMKTQTICFKSKQIMQIMHKYILCVLGRYNIYDNIYISLGALWY